MGDTIVADGYGMNGSMIYVNGIISASNTAIYDGSYLIELATGLDLILNQLIIATLTVDADLFLRDCDINIAVLDIDGASIPVDIFIIDGETLTISKRFNLSNSMVTGDVFSLSNSDGPLGNVYIRCSELTNSLFSLSSMDVVMLDLVMEETDLVTNHNFIIDSTSGNTNITAQSIVVTGGSVNCRMFGLEQSTFAVSGAVTIQGTNSQIIFKLVTVHIFSL